MLENLVYVKEVAHVSTNYVIASLFLYMSTIFSIVAFFCPYWSKYAAANNLNDHFLNIGMWQVLKIIAKKSLPKQN
jgi:hypothetical protein